MNGLYRRGEALRCDQYGDAKINKDMVDTYKGVYSDFFYHDLLPWPDEKTMGLDPKEHTFHDINDGSRWGKFEPDELFLLYDEEDIKKMVGLLTGSTKVEGERS